MVRNLYRVKGRLFLPHLSCRYKTGPSELFFMSQAKTGKLSRKKTSPGSAASISNRRLLRRYNRLACWGRTASAVRGEAARPTPASPLPSKLQGAKRKIGRASCRERV